MLKIKDNGMLKKFLQLPRLWLFLIPVLAGVLMLALAVTLRPSPVQLPTKEASTSVRIIEVPQVSLVPRAVGYGIVLPGRVWQAGAEVAGKIVEIHPHLKRGAVIGKGEVLLKIDPTDYRLAILQAEADIRATNAQIKELDGREENTKASLKIENRSLELSQRDFERKRKLLKQGSVSQAALDKE